MGGQSARDDTPDVDEWQSIGGVARKLIDRALKQQKKPDEE